MRVPKVTIVILNWNGLVDTIECLESVFKQEYANYCVIVVDNGSSDNSVEVLRDRYPDIIIIENQFNTGFTGGNNAAIVYAMNSGTDYVWLLNNDTVVEQNCLAKIIGLAESSDDIGMTSPVINYYSNRNIRQFSGSIINWQKCTVEYPCLDTVVEQIYISGQNVCLWGTALLIKAETIRRVGVLKDEYFAYWEDTEYSLRTIKAGYRNVLCEDAFVYHKSPMNKIRKSNHYHYYMTRNKLLMMEEYLPVRNRIQFYWKQLTVLIVQVGKLCRSGADEYANSRLNGYWHAMHNISGQMNIASSSYINRVIMYFSKKYPYFIFNIMNGNIRDAIRQIGNRYIK